MNSSPESVPTVWTSADESFFRVAWDVFTPGFLAGAGVLLASYDTEVPVSAASPVPAGATADASVDAPTRATA